MTDPSQAFPLPAWQPPSQVWTPPAVVEPGLSWRVEGLVALIVTAYSTVLGGLVGVLWPHFAPHIDIESAVNGSEASAKALLGDDMWFALLAIAAGAVCAAVLTVVSRDAGGGPGGLVGLAVGGVLGSLVAVHVGHGIQNPHVASQLRAAFPGITPGSQRTILGYFGFTVRMHAALLVWPIAAVLVQAGPMFVRMLRDPAHWRS